MREYDEAHVQRLLRAELEKHGGNYNATERALGVRENCIWEALARGNPTTNAAAKGVGFRRKHGGMLTPAHRPLKFVRLEDE